MGTNIDLKIISVALAVSLVVGIGCGYMVGNSPIPGLMEENDLLEAEYDNLARVRTSLEENYSELRTEKEDLEKDYSVLEGDYKELNSILEAGEALAESAEWITEDERLKVTSEVISTLIWSTTFLEIRVNITNIGEKPIDKVVIFVIPFEDGKFGSRDRYYSHTVEDIYLGETYSHDFAAPREMTSYKVLAVAG